MEEVKESPKFTPGPWYPVEFSGFWILNDGPHYEDRELLNEEGCECAEQNATLASAAPDMYEALKELYELHILAVAAVNYPIGKCWLNAAEKAKSALSKAEGKTQNS